MEIFELRYFLGVAQKENIHRASRLLNVSPGSLSKAIKRLEDELGVKLFLREGRNIKLTDHGRVLQQKASEIIHLEESAKTFLLGHEGNLKIDIAGPEVLLTHFGLNLTDTISEKFPRARFEFHAVSDSRALEQVLNGEVHLAIVTSDTTPGCHSKILGDASFRTYVGRSHPLFGMPIQKKPIDIAEILKFGFVSSSHSLLGAVGARQSSDGWRDDKFPRQVKYLASSLKVLEEITVGGKALAYLPDYFAEKLDLRPLSISGCPYSCVQKIRAVYRNPKELGWLNQIF